MATARTAEPIHKKPLRLWPGVVLVALQWLVRFALPAVVPGTEIVAVLGGVLGGLAVVVWWLLASRAAWPERVGAVVLMAGALFAMFQLTHPSIATAGMGTQFFFYAIPLLSLAFVAWAAATRNLADGVRRATMVVAVLLACGVWTLLRTDGITGAGRAEFAWRWSKTAEDRLLAGAGDEPAARSAQRLASAGGAEWPGFRGPGRNAVVPGPRIATDWRAAPPVELWRRPVGPGISSFAVHGDRVYTQEQRGDDEMVTCYDAATGEPVWRHRDAARFWDSHAGAGPRSTPTLSGGRVYTFGATGILNALDAGTGTILWSRNAAADVGVETPGWGFASSPLVAGELVVVAAAGTAAAYDAATGEPRWTGPDGGGGYSSPQLVTIDGVEQLLQLGSRSTISFAPTTGAKLWEHPSPSLPIVQPGLTADGDLLIADVDGVALGLRSLSVRRGAGGWTVEERWSSNRLKPYFNDFVVHRGHAFGFDGSILASIDVADGERKWKGGRYGHGQLVLLPDQDLLLVVTEKGELALVEATPDRFTELARVPAIRGKTWNHPVLVGDLLLVRNAEEMAAFRLPLADA